MDSEVIASRIFPRHWASFGVHFTEDEFKERFIGTGQDADIVVETMARLPPDSVRLGEELFHAALESELRAVGGLPEILERLVDDAVCVASNSSSTYVVQALELCGLSHFFGSRVFSAHDVERPKPAPDVFLSAASKLGFNPSQCLVVEDSLPGVLAAKAAGMRVIAFAGASHFVPALSKRLCEGEPDVFCQSAQELSGVLLGAAIAKSPLG